LILTIRILALIAVIATGVGAPLRCASGQDSAAIVNRRATNTIWIAGGLGGALNGGLVGEWEAWVAHGPLALGVHSSSDDQIFEDYKHERSLLGGARIPLGRLDVLFAAGSAVTGGSRSNGEQSGSRTTFPTERVALFELAGDWNFSRNVGVHTTWFAVSGGQSAYRALVIGLTLGKLR
jgi:hypothetical protein